MEETILSYLAFNEKYARKVIPHLNEDLFNWQNEKIVFRLIKKYMDAYNTIPSRETLYIELANVNDISQQDFDETKNLIGNLKIDDSTNLNWLVDQTEIFVQDRSVHNAVRRSIQILNDPINHSKAVIPKLLQDALGVSFNSAIGHDFIEDAKARYDRLHQYEERVKFNLDYFNRITGGGLPSKTLNCLMASTGVGKSLAMCSMAAGNLMDQRNVLYITLELAEERVAQRIDANLLDVPIQELIDMSKEDYDKKIAELAKSTKGKLIIKEYPTAAANVTHFRHLLDELKIKKNFVPDIVYIDYLNLCNSARVKMGAGANSYTYIKSIAEELRGLAVEFNIPIMTATQANRDAIGSSDMSLTNTSESLGLPMTLDLMVALISTEELEESKQIMVKQLKNRFGDPAMHRKFFIGVNKAKMRLYDVSNEDDNDTPVMDNTDFGASLFDEVSFEKDVFAGFTSS